MHRMTNITRPHSYKKADFIETGWGGWREGGWVDVGQRIQNVS